MRATTLVAAVLAALLLAGCPGKPSSSRGSGRSGGARTEFVIHQTSAEHPEDQVIIWKEPGRKNRAFLLDPGTVVKVLETRDGSRYKQNHDLYRIEDPNGRTGWVPSPWVKERKKK